VLWGDLLMELANGDGLSGLQKSARCSVNFSISISLSLYEGDAGFIRP
jgi:hypothetical protein